MDSCLFNTETLRAQRTRRHWRTMQRATIRMELKILRGLCGLCVSVLKGAERHTKCI